MQLLNSYLAGCRQVKKYWQVLLFFFSANLLFALLISLPLQSALVHTFGYSQVSQELLAKIELNNLVELLKANPPLFQQLKDNFFYAIFIYFVLMLFLTGGAIKIFVTRPTNFSVHSFLASGLDFWSRMIWLSILRLGILLLLVVIHLMLFGIVSNLLDTNNEVLLFRILLLLGGFGVIFYLLLSVFVDYWRIVLVAENVRFFLALKQTLAFFGKNKLNSIGLYLLILFTGLIFAGLYWLLSDIFNSGTETAVVVIFLVQQLYILSRTGIKLLFFAGQADYYISQKHSDFQNTIHPEILTVHND